MLLTLKEINQEALDIKSFKFSKENINFIPGQYLSVKLDVKDDKGKLRSFSIASSLNEDFIMIATKMTGSNFKNKLSSLKTGTKVEVTGPYGNFTLDETKDAIMLSGGIGITPLRSMIKYAAEKKLKNKIILFYSNRVPEEIAFRKDLENLAKLNKNFTLLNTITRPEESKETWNGLTGRIDADLIKKYINNNTLFYICGPPGMVDAMANILKEMNISQNRIKIEHFTGY